VKGRWPAAKGASRQLTSKRESCLAAGLPVATSMRAHKQRKRTLRSESQLRFTKLPVYLPTPLHGYFPPRFPPYPPFPAVLQDPGCSSVSQAPRQHLVSQARSSTRLSARDPGCSAAARSHPSPSERPGCFPANAPPALDYFFFCLLGFLPSQPQLAKIHLEFKSKRAPPLHNPAAAAAASARHAESPSLPPKKDGM